MKWINENWRASIAVGGCVFIWVGIAMKTGLATTLISTGALAILGALLSMLPSDL
jgi:hypothetical protein